MHISIFIVFKPTFADGRGSRAKGANGGDPKLRIDDCDDDTARAETTDL